MNYASTKQYSHSIVMHFHSNHVSTSPYTLLIKFWCSMPKNKATLFIFRLFLFLHANLEKFKIHQTYKMRTMHQKNTTTSQVLWQSSRVLSLIAQSRKLLMISNGLPRLIHFKFRTFSHFISYNIWLINSFPGIYWFSRGEQKAENFQKQ